MFKERQLFLPTLDPTEAVDLFTQGSTEERGAVFTKGEVAEFIWSTTKCKQKMPSKRSGELGQRRAKSRSMEASQTRASEAE